MISSCFEFLLCAFLVFVIIMLLVTYKDVFFKKVDGFLLMPPNLDAEMEKDLIIMTNDYRNPYARQAPAYQKVNVDGVFEDVPLKNDYYDDYKHTIECNCPEGIDSTFGDCRNRTDVFNLMELSRVNNEICDIGDMCQEKDKRFVNKKINDNLEKFSTLRNSLYVNTNLEENAIDKLNDIRYLNSSYDDYGETNWEVYDNLLKRN